MKKQNLPELGIKKKFKIQNQRITKEFCHTRGNGQLVTEFTYQWKTNPNVSVPCT